jgi:hypothetical protein
MPENTFQELQANINRLEHLYNLFRRSGDENYAAEARKLLKQMRKQFKVLINDLGISHDEFLAMMKGDPEDES